MIQGGRTCLRNENGGVGSEGLEGGGECVSGTQGTVESYFLYLWIVPIRAFSTVTSRILIVRVLVNGYATQQALPGTKLAHMLGHAAYLLVALPLWHLAS